jgi:hypothetical protein
MLIRSDFESRFQKSAQMILIWVIPFVGAILVIAVLSQSTVRLMRPLNGSEAVTLGCREWAPSRTAKAVTTVIGETVVMVGTAEMAGMGANEQNWGGEAGDLRSERLI